MIRSLLLALALLGLAPTAVHAAEEPGDREVREVQRQTDDFQKQLEQVRETLQQRIESVGVSREGLERMRAKVMTLAHDEVFLKSLGSLWNHPDRQNLWIAELVFFLVMVLFKAWRQARASNWFTRLLVGFVLSLLTWFGMALVIPAVVLGEPYRQVIGTLWRTFGP